MEAHPGQLLKTWRKRAGLNQEALAVSLGVVQQTISLWERGAYIPSSRWPGIAVALRLPDAETERLKRALVEQYAATTRAVA